jgi:hypothetical protein
MGSIPYALSIHNFITKVGSDAGFAAIIGLAILVLLYFAQARETSSLREQAYESAQRVQQLEARLAQLARPQAQAGAQPAPPPPGAAQAVSNSIPSAPLRAGATASAASRAAIPSSPGAPARISVPAAPAGVGAPALATATRLIPSPVSASPLVPQPVAAGVGAHPGPATMAGAAVADRAIDETSVTTLRPATAAAAAGGNGLGREPVGAAAGHAGVPSGGRSGGAPPPRVQIRPGGAAPGRRRPTVPPQGLQPQREPTSPGRRGLVALLAALGVAGVVAVLLIVTSSGGGKQPNSTSVRNSNAPVTHHSSRPATPAFKPSSVTVAVLNGTSYSRAAGRWATKLAADGYKKGAITNGPDQTRTTTVVAYLPGFKSDALQVAKSLSLGSGAVQAVDSPTLQTLACQQSSSCSANVVVTVGADLASRA